MANSKTFWYTLDHLIINGFPPSTIGHDALLGDIEYQIGLEVVMDSWGCASNGWDEPGEAAEYHIDKDSIEVKPDRDDVLPLSDSQLDFLESFINDDVQKFAAEFDDENYDYD